MGSIVSSCTVCGSTYRLAPTSRPEPVHRSVVWLYSYAEHGHGGIGVRCFKEASWLSSVTKGESRPVRSGFLLFYSLADVAIQRDQRWRSSVFAPTVRAAATAGIAIGLKAPGRFSLARLSEESR
jgi:hypothetical protein